MAKFAIVATVKTVPGQSVPIIIRDDMSRSHFDLDHDEATGSRSHPSCRRGEGHSMQIDEFVRYGQRNASIGIAFDRKGGGRHYRFICADDGEIRKFDWLVGDE